MRALKIVGYVAAGLVSLIVLLLLFVALFVNPNDFKPRIIAAVKSSTGRDLSMPGDLKLSVFPWIALQLGPAQLGSPPEFGNAPFASLEHASMRVKVLPLLHKQLEIGRIEITGLTLQLTRNAQGRGNWQGPVNAAASPAAATPAQRSSQPARLPDLAGIDVKDSRFTYAGTIANKLNFSLGHVTPDKPIPASLSLELDRAGSPPLPISSKFELTFDPDKQTLNLANFMLQVSDAKLAGQVSGTHVLDAPALQGQFKLEPVSLRELMPHLGMTLPVTRDPKVLSKFALGGAFKYGQNATKFEALTVELDDSKLQGSAAVENLDTLQSTFELSLNHIDVDRYLPPPQPNQKAAPPPAAHEAKGGTSDSALRTLDTKGAFTIGSLKVSGLTLTSVKLGLLAKDGVMHLAPISAKLYGGDAAGELTLDSREAIPALKIDETLSNVDLAPLLKDFAKSDRLSGHGNVTINVAARGADGDALTRSMVGRVTANVTNGAVQGLDLWFEVNRAMALIQKQGLPPGKDSGRTEFQTFKTSADLADGVATTKDLAIASQNLQISGKGTSNLISKAIDYQVLASILKSAPAGKGAPAGSLAQIPLSISGTMSSPSVRPDLEGMAKARLQQELDKHKDELKQKAQEQLKGLFGH